MFGRGVGFIVDGQQQKKDNHHGILIEMNSIIMYFNVYRNCRNKK